MKKYTKPETIVIGLVPESLIALSLQDGNGEANPDVDVLSFDEATFMERSEQFWSER